MIFDGVAFTATGFLVESNAGTPGLEYTVEAFNWSSESFDVIGVQQDTFDSDSTHDFPIVQADHVDGAGNVRSRVGWRQVGFTINFPWEVRVDLVGWIQ